MRNKSCPCVDCLTFPICKSEITSIKNKVYRNKYSTYGLRYKCNLLNKYFMSDDIYNTKSEYEKRYKVFHNIFNLPPRLKIYESIKDE